VYALQNEREAVGAASRDHLVDRWLVVSRPLAIDDDPEWDGRPSVFSPSRFWDHEPLAA
jgi:hypothetical protein